MALHHRQVRHEHGHRFGDHRTAVIGIDRELLPLDALLDAGFGNQLLSQCGRFDFGDHPADHVTAVNVDDDVQIVVNALAGAAQFGNIVLRLPSPAVDLIWTGSHEFRLLVSRVAQLVATLADLMIFGQYAVHSADGA